MGKWTKGRIRLDRTRAGRAIVSECHRTIAAAHLLGGSHTEAEADANAERIVACWNAMTGIEDPAAFMEEVRGALDVLEDYFDNRADADQAPGDIPTPNEEMRHQVTIRALLAKMEKKDGQPGSAI